MVPSMLVFLIVQDRWLLYRSYCSTNVYRLSIRPLFLTTGKNNGCTCLKEPGIREYSSSEMILLKIKAIILFIRQIILIKNITMILLLQYLRRVFLNIIRTNTISGLASPLFIIIYPYLNSLPVSSIIVIMKLMPLWRSLTGNLSFIP